MILVGTSRGRGPRHRGNFKTVHLNPGMSVVELRNPATHCVANFVVLWGLTAATAFTP